MTKVAQTNKTVNELLEENKDKHETILLIGFNKNGKIHIDTNRPTFEFVNYAINRANYNINHLETAQVLQSEHELPASVDEGSVGVEVNNEVTEMKKRGRPKKVK